MEKKMTRADCEKAILSHLKEIVEIYQQYVPGGQQFEIRFHKVSNGNDYSDWNELAIEMTNSWSGEGETSFRYEQDRPVSFEWSFPIEDECYQRGKEGFDAYYGEGAWDEEMKWNKSYNEFGTIAYHDSDNICRNDFGFYYYSEYLKKQGIAPAYDEAGNLIGSTVPSAA